MPTFKLVDEQGVWLTDMRLGRPDWKPGDRIYQGSNDTLEVVEVRSDGERPVLVVRDGHVHKSD